MKNKKFSIEEAIMFGWETVKKNFTFFIGLFIIVFLIRIVASFVFSSIKEKDIFYWLLYSLDIVLSMIISLGLIRVFLNFIDDTKSEIKDLFSQYRLFFNYLIAYLVYLFIIFLGFVFLIIPGIYLMIRLQFFKYLIVDKKMKPMESLKKSWTMTNGSALNLFLFGVAVFFANLFGFIFFFVGLMVSVPVTMMASTFVYRKLLNQVNQTESLGINTSEQEKTPELVKDA
jgi:uncharacterized membrane protein